MDAVAKLWVPEVFYLVRVFRKGVCKHPKQVLTQKSLKQNHVIALRGRVTR